LRTTLVYICLENSAFAAAGAEIVFLMEQHEPVAWHLGRRVLMKSLELLPMEEVSKPEKQADRNEFKAEFQQLRNELKSVSTALIRYQPPQPQEAKSKASDAEARQNSPRYYTWGALRRAEKGLRSDVTNLTSEVTTLKNSLEEAQKRIKDCQSCRVCRRQFFALLKVDLPKGDIWVKCRSCGGNHR
jgi:hypothetical protein